MRRIAAVILLLAVCALAGPVQAQNRSTRPRRVGNGNATPAPVSVPAPQPRVVTEDNATDEPARDPNRRPPTLGGTDNSGTATRRPPTLGGTSAPDSTPAARTSAPDSNGPVEVGGARARLPLDLVEGIPESHERGGSLGRAHRHHRPDGNDAG